MTTPWSTDVEVLDAGHIRVQIMLSLDPGPVRVFDPFLSVDLDEAHATELLCKLGMALQERRQRAQGDAS